MISSAAKGFLAGAAGTIAMGGTAFLIRRMVEPTKPIGKTHYEAVVEWVAESTGEDTKLDQATRIRAGELLHIGFGAFWGAVFGVLTRKRAARPLTDGTTYGLILWLGAFGGYMPSIGISSSLREMGNYERLRTLASHLVYAITTFTFMKALRSDRD